MPIVLICMNFRTIFRCAGNIAATIWAKMRSSRKFVANFRANFCSVLQAFLRKVHMPWSKYESSFCCAGVKHSRNLFADFSLQSTQPTVLSNSPGYSPWKAKLCTQNPKALHFLIGTRMILADNAHVQCIQTHKVSRFVLVNIVWNCQACHIFLLN